MALRALLAAACILLWNSAPASTQATKAAAPPRFEDYPATDIFEGTPAPPQLATTEEQAFRTRIRNGVTKGEGVHRDGTWDQPGPNFAGRFIVIEWTCGSPCNMMAIVDARTGHVYAPPISDNPGKETLRLPNLLFSIPGTNRTAIRGSAVGYQQNSRLMIVRGNPGSNTSENYTYYFLWQDNRWRLLRQIRLERMEDIDR